MYRLGWIFANLLAKLGIPLLIKVEIIHDDEANVYIATSSDLIGLVVEAETLDELQKEVLELVKYPFSLFSTANNNMNGYEKLVKEQLLKHGYKLVRTGKGSHEIWASKNGISVTVNHVCKCHYESRRY